ncbi:aspergillopepsin A-like aspartic endopeptidase [Penicillium chermesinum]|nr:aspergillopepsin A-like aspartic endopeptidase [Penicillium chermesinum]
MHLLLSLALFLVLGYNALALPTMHRPVHHVRRSRSFQIDRFKRSDYVRHGQRDLQKAYRKYGIIASASSNNEPYSSDPFDFEPFVWGFGGSGTPSDSATSSNSATTSGTATTTSDSTESQTTAASSEETGSVAAKSVQGDSEFVSPVLIGGQTISLDFDTGSADMWVLGSSLSSKASSDRKFYDPKTSSDYEEVDGSFNIQYGDNSYANGDLAQDLVNIGGAIVPKQVFGIATDASSEFLQDTASDGLLGLSFSKLNSFKPGPQKTFFDNVAADLEEPVFTTRLRTDAVGEYGFGVIDHSLYQGTMANISVDSSAGFWAFKSAAYAVGNGELTDFDDVTTAIADTGTTLMLLSPTVVKAYYAQVSGASYASSVGGYVFPCSTTPPNLTMKLGDSFTATVPGAYINYSQVGTNKTSGETICMGGVQSNQGSNMQIFGDVFLKSFYVVFDQRGPSLGIALTK